MMIIFYHQIKTLIVLWCKQNLNYKSLIQKQKTLPIDLTKIKMKFYRFKELNLSKLYIYIYIYIYFDNLFLFFNDHI